MKKVLAAAGIGAAAIATTVGVAAPASAHYADVDTMVTWVGGDSWLTVDYPGEGVVMESSGAKIVNHSFTAHPGDRIGADPIMGDADYITCTVWVKNRIVATDSAYAGDGTDANCVRILR